MPTIQSYYTDPLQQNHRVTCTFFSLRHASESGRVRVPVPIPRSPTSESSLVIVVSVLGVVILLVFAPIIVIIIVLSKGRCTSKQLKKELDYTRYTNRKAQTGV